MKKHRQAIRDMDVMDRVLIGIKQGWQIRTIGYEDEVTEAELEELNSQGFGIYVSSLPMLKKEWLKRNKALVGMYSECFIDIDVPLGIWYMDWLADVCEMIMKLPIPPSLTVLTYKWFHLHRYLRDNPPQGIREQIMDGIYAYNNNRGWYADMSTKEPARILRVPGYRYNKNYAWTEYKDSYEFRITKLDSNGDGRSYYYKDLAKHYFKRVEEEKLTFKKQEYRYNSESLDYEAIDPRQVAEDILWEYCFFEDGTDCWYTWNWQKPYGESGSAKKRCYNKREGYFNNFGDTDRPKGWAWNLALWKAGSRAWAMELLKWLSRKEKEYKNDNFNS